MSLIQSLRNIFASPTTIVDDQDNELSKSDISRIKLTNSFAAYCKTQYTIEDIQKSYNEDLEELNELAKGNEAVNNRLEAQIRLLDERLIKSVQLANQDQNKALEELKKAISEHVDILEKSKKAVIGEVRTWSDGKQYKKTINGWVEYHHKLNHTDIKKILDEAQIKYTLEVSHKNNSHYWSIEGDSYRVADHDKPEGAFGYETFKNKKGTYDFRSYDDFFKKIKERYDLSSKENQEKEYKERARKFIKQREDGLYVQPDGTLYDDIDLSLKNMWRLKKPLPDNVKKSENVHTPFLFTKRELKENMNKAQVYKTGRFLYEDKLKYSLGRKRETMPQIDSNNIDDVVLHFQGKSPNTKVTKETINIKDLQFAQGEINEDKVLSMLKESPKQSGRFLVAKNKGKYTLIDGHHRGAYMLELDPEMDIDVYAIHLDPLEAIRRLNLMKVSSKSDISKSENSDFITEETLNSANESAFLVIEKAFNNNEITVDQFLDARQKYELIKARSGVYADNATNRRLNRVGQKFGSDKKSEEQSQDKAKKNDSESTKTYSDSELAKHAKNASQADLERQIKEGKDPALRAAANKELDRRQKEERVQGEDMSSGEENSKKNSDKYKIDTPNKNSLYKDNFNKKISEIEESEIGATIIEFLGGNSLSDSREYFKNKEGNVIFRVKDHNPNMARIEDDMYMNPDSVFVNIVYDKNKEFDGGGAYSDDEIKEFIDGMEDDEINPNNFIHITEEDIKNMNMLELKKLIDSKINSIF